MAMREYLTAYVDDLIIASETFEDHLRHLGELFKRLKDDGLTINLSKTLFCRKEIPFLGHIISAEGIKPCPEKLTKIQNFCAPKNVRQVRQLIGFCNFYRKFVPRYASLLSPLNELLKKGQKFKWDETHQESLEKNRIRKSRNFKKYRLQQILCN